MQITSASAASGQITASPHQRERKNITAERLREIEDGSIREVVKLQEEVGLEGITDGELARLLAPRFPH